MRPHAHSSFPWAGRLSLPVSVSLMRHRTGGALQLSREQFKYHPDIARLLGEGMPTPRLGGPSDHTSSMPLIGMPLTPTARAVKPDLPALIVPDVHSDVHSDSSLLEDMILAEPELVASDSIA
eukprot:gnl/Dysnectes_brevis/36293_a788612_10.p1 GENE.gnl/Dysnectes_brevis/36293_a788612_10~~gnl/Dysnectes_brevis/36293_a788612_10.p1  ORF type:complete len:123 (+),score=41.35 gnl/Dysnectes_brevis/36293_a788612_10:1-369(+)